jgi:predicted thioesterase
MDSVKIGSTKERSVKIESSQTTTFLWEGENVLSTPSMISEMEETCRLLLKEQFLLENDWDSVGTLVNVRHTAATPVGATVVFKARVTATDGRRIVFDVEASDSMEKIGEGQHERVIINVTQFKAKFLNKQKQLMAL